MIKEGIKQAMSTNLYQYQYGDRPLEGYTIQRAAGRGGFGEVYYAVSDSGRQVALKVIQNCSQIELRGISQCMNLKSPHLVTIFDIKYSEHNDPFVVMEYVAGPSLRQLLDESPDGLGEQKAAFFLREIAKGLAYLHDCGIVHRDLKPANIFYENGYVKIGDYGLSKIINADHHTGQTITVGTVHYMAPEIGAGKYDRSIDIYALGILLYEMLTGQVPYFGASPGEILMKHLSSEPDLSGINPSFAKVIRKALAKDPNERYHTVRDMLEDVFGSEYIRNSISQFSPDDLSDIAKKVAEKMQNARNKTKRQKVTPPPDGAGTQDYVEDRSWENFGRKIGKIGDQVREKVRSRVETLKAGNTGHSQPPPATGDPLGFHQRKQLALITLACVSAGTALITNGFQEEFWISFLFIGLNMLGASMGILWARWSILRNMEPTPLRNILLSAFGVIGGFLPCLIIIGANDRYPLTIVQASFAVIILSIVDIWKLTAPDRDQRISLSRSVMAAVIGMVVAGMFDVAYPPIVGGILAGILLAIQAASPYIPQEIRKYYKGQVVSEPAGKTSFVAPPVAGVSTNEPMQNPVPMPQYQSVSMYNQARISPKKRLVAFILAFFFGVLGFHRIYVGKIGSAILWLLTGGLFGLGWLYDIIMILAGEFRDSEGRRLTNWVNHPDYKTEVGSQIDPAVFDSRRDHASYYYGGEFQPLSVLLGFMGSILLLMAFTLGLVNALNVPEFVQRAIPELANEIQTELFNNYEGWPHLVERVTMVATVLLFFISATFVVIGRRNRGPFHIIRAVVGIGILGIVLPIINEAMPWQFTDQAIQMFKESQIVGGIDMLLDQIDVAPMVFACIMAGASLVLLAWPARRLLKTNRYQSIETPEKVSS